MTGEDRWCRGSVVGREGTDDTMSGQDVDQLLTEIRSRGYDVSITALCTHGPDGETLLGGRPVAVRLTVHWDASESRTISASSLLDALLELEAMT